MTLMKESFILIAVCLSDLAFTVFLLHGDQAAEGNPLMAYYLQFGLGVFVLIKLVLLVFPLIVAEWSKQYRPKFVKTMLRFTIVAYVGGYILLFLGVNVPTMADNLAKPNSHATQMHKDASKR